MMVAFLLCGQSRLGGTRKALPGQDIERKSRPFMCLVSLVLVIVYFVLAAGNCSMGDELQDYRSLIEDGIRANLASIRRFDALVTENEQTSFATGGKVLEDRVIRKELQFDGERWRQHIKTSLLDRPTGKRSPYESDTVFDGDRTTRFAPYERNATIEGGSRMEDPPTPDLGHGYRYLDWLLPETLKFASNIKQIETAQTGGNGKLLEVTLPSTRGDGYVTTVFLDPSAGFLIVRAHSHDSEGRPASERRGTRTMNVGGAWFLVDGDDETWDYPIGSRRTLERIKWNIVFRSVNQPLPATAFDLTIPRGTAVIDQVAGTKTVLGEVPRSGSPRDSLRWVVIAGVAACVLFLGLVVYRKINNRGTS